MSPIDGGGTDATPPSDGSPAGDDATTDGAAPADASVLDGSDSDGAVPLGAFGAPLVAAASDDGSALVVSAPSGAPMTTPLRFTRYVPGAGWTAPADVPGTDTTWDTNRLPVLGMDASGNAFLAWTGFDAGSLYHFHVARFDGASGTWGAAATPDTYAAQSGATVGLSVAPGGDALVVATHTGTAAAREVYAFRYAAGAWTGELVAALGASAITTPRVVRFLDGGRAIVTWFGNIGDGLATRDAAGTWTPGPTLASVSASDQTDAAIDAAGDAIFVAQGTSPLKVFQLLAVDGGAPAWTGPTTLGTAVNDTTGIAVGMTSAGDAFVTHATQAAVNAVPLVESYAYTGASKAWGPAQPLAMAGRPLAFSVATATTGDALASWFEQPEGGTSYTATRATYALATGWAAESPLSADGLDVNAQGITPFVAPGGQHAFVAWTDGGNTLVAKIR